MIDYAKTTNMLKTDGLDYCTKPNTHNYKNIKKSNEHEKSFKSFKGFLHEKSFKSFKGFFVLIEFLFLFKTQKAQLFKESTTCDIIRYKCIVILSSIYTVSQKN